MNLAGRQRHARGAGVDQKRPAVVDSAMPSPPSQTEIRAAKGIAGTPLVEHLGQWAGETVVQALEECSGSSSAGSASALVRARDVAVARSSGGKPSAGVDTFTPMPSTAHPSCWPALDEDAGELAAVHEHVAVGHLIRVSTGTASATATAAASGSDSGGSRSTTESSKCRAGWREPAAALSSAAGGLLVCRDERPVRRARRGQRLGALVVESTTRWWTLGVPIIPAGGGISASGRTPSVAAASPRRPRARASGRRPRTRAGPLAPTSANVWA